MNVITGSWMSHAVCVTVQLGIPDPLAKGPCTAEELSSKTESLGRRHRPHHWGGRSSSGARRRVAVLHCAEVAPLGHRVRPCYDCDFYDLRQLASPVRFASCGNRPARPMRPQAIEAQTVRPSSDERSLQVADSVDFIGVAHRAGRFSQLVTAGPLARERL